MNVYINNNPNFKSTIYNNTMYFRPIKKEKVIVIPEIEPILNFRGKNITSLDDFNSDNVKINWIGNCELVPDGIRTRQDCYGEFTYDFSDLEEFSVSYTFVLYSRAIWHVLLNLACSPTNDTYGLRFAHNKTTGIKFLDFSEASNSIVVATNKNIKQPNVDLNKKYNMVITISKNDPIKFYVNGVLLDTSEQPDGQKGWNGFKHKNVNKNAFNMKLQTNQSVLDVTHYALRIWDKALSEEQVINEFNKDNKDYQIL